MLNHRLRRRRLQKPFSIFEQWIHNSLESVTSSFWPLSLVAVRKSQERKTKKPKRKSRKNKSHWLREKTKKGKRHDLIGRVKSSQCTENGQSNSHLTWILVSRSNHYHSFWKKQVKKFKNSFLRNFIKILLWITTRFKFHFFENSEMPKQIKITVAGPIVSLNIHHLLQKNYDLVLISN